MVHTLLLGGSVLQALHLNLLTQEIVADSLGPNSWGKPIWELPVETSADKAAIQNATSTYLGRLVPVSRAVRLDDEGATIILANGLDYPIFPASREATATIIKRKEQLALLPASTSRSLWRQLAAISVRRRSAADAPSGPLALVHTSTSASVTLWVGALVTDKAKIEDVIESTYSLPAGMFTEFGRAAYEQGVGYAEENEGLLIQAVKAYAKSLKVAAPAYDRARRHFWTHVEQHLASLFELARNTELAATLPDCSWGRAVQAAVSYAFAQSCPRQTPRQIEAFALGLRRLNFPPRIKPNTANDTHE
jgi:CRISPR system Cascade subunit CasA